MRAGPRTCATWFAENASTHRKRSGSSIVSVIAFLTCSKPPTSAQRTVGMRGAPRSSAARLQTLLYLTYCMTSIIKVFHQTILGVATYMSYQIRPVLRATRLRTPSSVPSMCACVTLPCSDAACNAC